MGNKLIVLFFLIGVLTLCVGAPSDGVESSTSTSVSVSTVTRKVTSRSFSRSHHVPNDTKAVTEDMLGRRVQDVEKHSGEENDAVTKPQKIKKKILASNLKNISEKVVVVPSDKHEKTLLKPVFNSTEAIDGGKPNSSDSSEDEIIEDVHGKSENISEVSKNKTLNEESKRSGGPIEGRSLEDRSSEENVNVNEKAKTKTFSTSTVRTTNGYSYETFSEVQKVLNNNYLNNNEGYEQKAGSHSARSSPSVILAAKKSPSISRDNSLKNAIRFDGEYYGPTGQTDWVPIIPDKLPMRSFTGGTQNFGTKLKSPVVEKSNKTNERNTIVFPSDGVQPFKDASTIPVRETEAEKTTTRIRSSASTSTEKERENATQLTKHLTKFRGTVRYKPLQSNSSADDKKFLNETVLKKNISLETPAMEIPVTGASWTLATLGGPGKSTPKLAVEETTEISVVSSTNHTTKSQNAVDGGLVVPPENVKIENITKETQMKTIISGISSDDVKQNKSEITNSLPKMIDGGNGWIPIKIGKDFEIKNKTDPVLPESMLANQKNESVAKTVVFSTSESDTASEDVTTEEVTATESIPELTTLPKLTIPTIESSASFDVSSQSGNEFASVTSTKDEGEEATASSPTKTSVALDSPSPTTLKFETDVETSTEALPTTLSEIDLTAVVLSTERAEISEATPTPSPVPSVSSSAFPSTKPGTVISVETTNPEPNVTKITAIPSTTKPSTSTTLQTVTSKSTLSTVLTTSVKKLESKTEEEGIYYKNYIPTTMGPHVEITEENVPAYLRLTVQAKGWEELCRLKEDLREAIIKVLGGKNVSAESVHFLNLNEKNCQEKIEKTGGDAAHNGTAFLPVNMFLMDKNGDFDKNLSEAFLTLWGRRGLDFELPIRKVDFVTPIVNLTELADPPLGGSVVAAIVISCVAGICVILLGVLFVIMKRRQKRFNYGQRCTPVSLDAYSLDSVSIYNSVRRKGVRASKRSYGNAAFDDPGVPTHPMNFAGLANFSSDREQLYEEFNMIPQVYPKVEELPPGAETKNRYANIIPLPETRVHLNVKDGDPLSDYINANYVRGLKGAEKLYIACQAPMESTVEDFWRMVWEQQCKVILMLTDLQENGIEKCADYLPPNEVTDNLRLFGDFQVTLKKRDVKEKYIISNLKLKNMEANLWREVTHLWYLGWPEQGVPSEANSLIAFLIEARSQMKIQNGATTTSPVVVHCSPGTGRTGTVIACDLCIREYEQSRMVDIPRCVFNLRRDRAGAVQTKDQYAFIYQVLNVYATKLSGGGIESI